MPPKKIYFAGRVITDGSEGSTGAIGLAFPIDVGYKAINGTNDWQKYLNDQDTLFAEWTTFRAERDLLAAHIRGEIPYKDVIHLVEKTPNGLGLAPQ